MKISARSVLMAGVTTITASAVVIAPSVQPLPPPKPTIQLAASSQLLQLEPGLLQQILSGNVAELLTGVLIPPGLGTPPPAPPPPPTIPPSPVPSRIGSSIATFVENAYPPIEYWVDYGFSVGAWAFGWVPWIGWLAPQIWPIGYNFGERLVHAIVFNITDWFQGQGTVISNVVDWGAESIDALIAFGIDQWNFWIGFPLPPRPGGLAATQTTRLISPTEISSAGADTPVGKFLSLIGRVLDNPLDTGEEETRPNPGSALRSFIKNGIAGLDDFLGLPSLNTANPTAVQEKSEVSTVPSIVKDSLKGWRNSVDTEVEAQDGPAGPLAGVRKTVRNLRSEIRENLNGKTSATGGNGVVRAQGEVRGPVGKAVTDVVDALRGGKPNKDATEATTPTSVAKSLGETARKVVKEVRQAAKDARDAAKNRTTAGDDDE